MTEIDEEELRARMSRLRDSLPTSGTAPVSRKRRRWGSRSMLLAVGALLVLTFGGGAVAREWVDRGWYTDGLFWRGGPLYCSTLQNMTPSKAAPILAALGYDVTWQIEGWPNTRSYQTKVAPDEGYLSDGIMKGHELVIIAEYDQKARGSACHD